MIIINMGMFTVIRTVIVYIVQTIRIYLFNVTGKEFICWGCLLNPHCNIRPHRDIRYVSKNIQYINIFRNNKQVLKYNNGDLCMFKMWMQVYIQIACALKPRKLVSLKCASGSKDL